MSAIMALIGYFLGLISGVAIMRYGISLGGRIVQDAASETTILGSGSEPVDLPSHTTLEEDEKEKE